MSQLDTVPLPFISLFPPLLKLENGHRDNFQWVLLQLLETWSILMIHPYRSPHDAIPDRGADLPLRQRDIRPF